MPEEVLAGLVHLGGTMHGHLVVRAKADNETPSPWTARAFLQVGTLRCSWAGAGSNRRPSTFQADARTD